MNPARRTVSRRIPMRARLIRTRADLIPAAVRSPTEVQATPTSPRRPLGPLVRRGGRALLTSGRRTAGGGATLVGPVGAFLSTLRGVADHVVVGLIGAGVRLSGLGLVFGHDAGLPRWAAVHSAASPLQLRHPVLRHPLPRPRHGLSGRATQWGRQVCAAVGADVVLVAVVIPVPVLARFEGPDHRMPRAAPMCRRVPRGRVVATADVTAPGAAPQVHPPPAGCLAFDTARAARGDRGINRAAHDSKRNRRNGAQSGELEPHRCRRGLWSRHGNQGFS